MLVEKKMSKAKQLVMVGLIVVTNMVVGFVLYKNFAPRKRPSIAVAPSEVRGQGVENLSLLETMPEDFEQSSSVLMHPDFRRLKKYGSWPVSVPHTGRPNPFLPLSQPQ